MVVRVAIPIENAKHPIEITACLESVFHDTDRIVSVAGNNCDVCIAQSMEFLKPFQVFGLSFLALAYDQHYIVRVRELPPAFGRPWPTAVCVVPLELQLPDERQCTVASAEITPFKCLVLAGTEVGQRIDPRSLLVVLLDKPDLIPAEQVTIQK